MDVRMPDGTVVKNVPDDMTKDQFMSAYQKNMGAAPPEPPSLMENLSKDVEAGAADRAKIQQEYDTGQTSGGMIGRGVHLAGSAARELGGMGADIIGSAAKTLTPELAGAVGSGVKAIAGSAPVQAVAKAYEENVSKPHPEAARYISDAAAIGGLTPLGPKAVVGAVQKPIGASKLLAEGATARGAEALGEAAEKIKNEAVSGFQHAERLGVGLSNPQGMELVRGLKGTVKELNTEATKDLYSRALKQIGLLEDDVRAGNTSLFNLHQHRQLIGNIAKDFTNPNKMQEAAQSSKMLDYFDTYMHDLAQKSKGTAASEGVDALYNGIAGWSRLRNFEKIADVVQRAEGDTKKLSAGLKKILDSDKLRAGLKENEIALLEKAAKGGATEKALSVLGVFGVNPKNLMDIGAKGIGYQAAHGFGLGGADAGALLATGTAAKGLASLSKRGRVEELLKAIEARNGPAPVYRTPNGPPAPRAMLPAPAPWNRPPGMSPEQIIQARAGLGFAHGPMMREGTGGASTRMERAAAASKASTREAIKEAPGKPDFVSPDQSGPTPRMGTTDPIMMVPPDMRAAMMNHRKIFARMGKSQQAADADFLDMITHPR